MDNLNIMGYLTATGMGLRLFQAIARSLQAPKEDSSGLYKFLYSFVQNMADNKDRLGETIPADGKLQTTLNLSRIDSTGATTSEITKKTVSEDKGAEDAKQV